MRPQPSMALCIEARSVRSPSTTSAPSRRRASARSSSRRTKARTLCPLASRNSVRLRPMPPTAPAAPVTRIGLSCLWFAIITTPSSASFSTSNPDRHAGLKPARIALRIETQPERIAIVIADRALGLPGREGAERPQLGDDARHRLACARTRDLDRRPDRQAAEQVLARVERQPLLASRRNGEHRLARTHVLADLGHDHTDDAVDGGAQDGLAQMP